MADTDPQIEVGGGGGGWGGHPVPFIWRDSLKLGMLMIIQENRLLEEMVHNKYLLKTPR